MQAHPNNCQQKNEKSKMPVRKRPRAGRARRVRIALRRLRKAEGKCKRREQRLQENVSSFAEDDDLPSEWAHEPEIQSRFACAFCGCSNRTDGTVSFFSFPKDPVRAKTWMEACNRKDLLTKASEELAEDYRLCEEHFEEKYIMKGLIIKSLTESAIPTIFLHKKFEAIEEVTPEALAQKAITVCDAFQTATDLSSNISSFSEVTEIPALAVPGSSTQDRENTISAANSVSCMSTETPVILSSNTPKKKELRETLRILLKRKRKRKLVPKEKEEWSKEDFFKMCDTFLPSALAEIVKAQVTLQDRKLTARRYSNEY